jgi:hypothetical protein
MWPLFSWLEDEPETPPAIRPPHALSLAKAAASPLLTSSYPPQSKFQRPLIPSLKPLSNPYCSGLLCA